jgi:hypothetical protein
MSGTIFMLKIYDKYGGNDVGRKVIVEIEKNNNAIDLNSNKEFIMNFKNAILLSLLNKKQITQWQYEKCTNLFKKNIQK